MSSSRRAIIFARYPESLPLPAGFKTRPTSRVILNDVTVGWIIQRGDELSYLLADSSPSGLPDVQARQDMERQISLYHFGPLPSERSVPDQFYRAAS